LITLLEDFTVQIVLAGGSQISWMGTKEKRRREGRREEAEGLTRIQNIRTVKRICGVSVSLVLVVVHFSFSNLTYELAFRIYCSPKPNWLYIP